MLAHDRSGEGAPLVLIHGTSSSRRVWDQVLPELAAHREVIALDLPGHGESPPTSFTPPEFAQEIAATLDALDLPTPAVVGHSVGGWTALELAKLGRAGAVLALAPAGLWRHRSPRLTNLGLQANWRLARTLGPVARWPLRTRVGRQLGLRTISARGAEVPYAVAAQTTHTAAASEHFPAHFAATRPLRFTGGTAIPPTIPVRVIWGDRDRIALAGKSRFSDELPAHAEIDTWEGCGHMVMWDQREQTIAAALAT